jgi:ankyrin repeat protein
VIRLFTFLLMSLVLGTLICWRCTGHSATSNGARNFGIGYKFEAVTAAIESRNAAALHDVLQDPSVDLNAVGEGQGGSLIYAVASGWPEGVRLLLDHHADPNLADNKGYTPLLYVWEAQSPAAGEIAELLIRHGADVNLRCGIAGQTPLGNATQMGRADLVKILLAARAEVNSADNRGTTALHIAAMVDQPEIITLLLSAGADPQARDAHGDRPIDVARDCGSVDSVKRLQSAR